MDAFSWEGMGPCYYLFWQSLPFAKLEKGMTKAENMVELILGEYLANTSLMVIFWFLVISKNPRICPEWRWNPQSRDLLLPKVWDNWLTELRQTLAQTATRRPVSLPLGSSWLCIWVMHQSCLLWQLRGGHYNNHYLTFLSCILIFFQLKIQILIVTSLV